MSREQLFSPHSSLQGIYPIDDQTIEDAALSQLLPGESLTPIVPAPIIDAAIGWALTHPLRQLLARPNLDVVYNLQGAEYFYLALRTLNPSFTGSPIKVSRSLGHMSFGEVDQSKLHWPEELADLTGRHLLVLEDINDEGETLKTVAEIARQKGAAAVTAMVLFEKLLPKPKAYLPAIALLSVPQVFLVGAGLDEGSDRFRTVNTVYQLHSPQAA